MPPVSVCHHVSTTGQPVYGRQEESIGDHCLDSIMIALVGLTLEYSDFFSINLTETIKYEEDNPFLHQENHASSNGTKNRIKDRPTMDSSIDTRNFKKEIVHPDDFTLSGSLPGV